MELGSSDLSVYSRILSRVERELHKKNVRLESASSQEGSRIIRNLILSRNPFMVGRIGTTESSILSWYRKFHKPLHLPYGGNIREGAWVAGGLFPSTDQVLSDWAAACEEALELSDVYAYWNLSMNNYYRTRHLSSAQFVDLGALDVYSQSDPWTLALSGMRVLVVHPFADLIISQYQLNREGLFPGRSILPEFQLEAVSTPLTLAGNTAGFGSWDEAFLDLCTRVDEHRFDIALVAGGTYGMPLCARIRKQNRSAIYVGGVLQIFFGIKGGRWDHLGLYNDSWTRPAEKYRPSGLERVEQGCYW